MPEGPTLHLGDSGPRVAALRARLAAAGDSRPGGGRGGDVFDEALVNAVRRFQARHGLERTASSELARSKELNVPVEGRIDQLRVNLERARWLLHDLPASFVFVNVAGFEVFLSRPQVVWESRVQVGKPWRGDAGLPLGHHLPGLQSDLDRSAGDPREDILPSQRAIDVAVPQRKGLKVFDGKGGEVAPRAVDWATIRARSRTCCARTRARQRARAGQVHVPEPAPRLPARHAEQESVRGGERAFSSGCIRVEDPLVLAERCCCAGAEAGRAARSTRWSHPRRPPP